MEAFIDFFNSKGMEFLTHCVSALLILLIGFYFANSMSKAIAKTMEKSNIEPTIISFLKSFINAGIKMLVIFTALVKVGFPTSSIAAIFGTIGAALALGFKDSLGSFVSGILILFNKPFKVGDYIEVGSNGGTVTEIQIMSTKLATIDNRIVVIPNIQMTTSTIINYSAQEYRRVDLTFSVDYNANTKKAKDIMLKAIEEHEDIDHDKEIFCRITSYEASSIDITLRVWTKTENYFKVKFDLLETIKFEFDEEGIVIPYQQVDVHIVERK